MRKQLCDALLKQAENPETVFLTGDLGFMALEPLQMAMGSRFINAGIAEQNMISVAAAMAKQGFSLWVYSIAPFCYARPFEQIRNDIAFHNLPVRLIGNGGGYGYGVMGPTHHAIEDYGILLTLPGMHVYLPAFDEDVESVVARASGITTPAYLRIGRGEPPKDYLVPAYQPWRQLTSGNGPVVIAAGPLAGTYLEYFLSMPIEKRPAFWVVSELPLSSNPPPDELINQIKTKSSLCIAEEHVEQGGFAMQFSLFLLHKSICVQKFRNLFARAHRFPAYGSQSFLREQSHLDLASIKATLLEMGNA
ncbi:MAG TPA: hypothetical protein PLF22_00195 [Pseudomonadales bacterium]|nr:hypothetical protein [Pseudomonadales bacterium]